MKFSFWWHSVQKDPMADFERVPQGYCADHSKEMERARLGVMSARDELDRLAVLVRDAAFREESYSLSDAVTSIHALRGHLDSILVGLVEVAAKRNKEHRE